MSTRQSILPLFIFTLLIALMSSSIAQVNWEKYVGNPVLVPGEPGTWNDDTLLPSCVLYDGETYHTWFGGHDGTTGRIGYASSPDGVNWTEYANNPVLDVGPGGSWDDSRISDPYVIFDENIYHMWYGGFDGENYSIGYAKSPNGINWTKHAGNPVMVRGPAESWNESHVLGPCVRIDGGNYHMWFSGENENIRQCIGYATSSDGINWTPFAGNPVLTPDPVPAWDQAVVQAPEVLFDGSSYHMWYSGIRTTSWWQWDIGYATAPDETTWTKYKDNPILPPTPGTWDSQWVGFCSVVLDKATNQFKMWYGGGSGEGNGKYGYATSPVNALDEVDYGAILNRFVLEQNYPNPFNPKTIINYELPIANYVELRIYNVLGQRVEILESRMQKAGFHAVEWDASNQTSGVYFYQLVAGECREVKKMILLK